MTAEKPETPTTSKGQPERRRTRYVPLAEYKRWKRGAIVAYVFVVLVSTGAAAWAYYRGKDANRDIVQSSANASQATCLSGSDLRIANAQGLDSLRRNALRVFRVPEPAAQRFLDATQRPVDRLLSQAAGTVITTDPAGPFTPERELAIRRQAMAKCSRRSVQNFGQSPDPPREQGEPRR